MSLQEVSTHLSSPPVVRESQITSNHVFAARCHGETHKKTRKKTENEVEDGEESLVAECVVSDGSVSASADATLTVARRVAGSTNTDMILANVNTIRCTLSFLDTTHFHS